MKPLGVLAIEPGLVLDCLKRPLFRGPLFGDSRLPLGLLTVARLLLLGLPFVVALLYFGADHVLTDAALLRLLPNALLGKILLVRAVGLEPGLALESDDSIEFLVGKVRPSTRYGVGVPFDVLKREVAFGL